jgi:hypothetical protein
VLDRSRPASSAGGCRRERLGRTGVFFAPGAQTGRQPTEMNGPLQKEEERPNGDTNPTYIINLRLLRPLR